MSGGKGSTFENDVLKLTLNGTAFSWNSNTNLYVSLHNGALTSASNQTTNETSYTGYARYALSRTSSGFTVSGGSATLTSAISFGACTGGTDTLTYFAIGTASSGTGEVLYWGPISPTISVANGVTPQLTTGTTITES